MEIEDCFKFKGNFHKNGDNVICLNGKEVVCMQVNGVNDGVLNLNTFISLQEGKGYGKAAIKFSFLKLPKVHKILLKCKESVLGFWKKAGGKVVAIDDYYTIQIDRKDVVLQRTGS